MGDTRQGKAPMWLILNCIKSWQNLSIVHNGTVFQCCKWHPPPHCHTSLSWRRTGRVLGGRTGRLHWESHRGWTPLSPPGSPPPAQTGAWGRSSPPACNAHIWVGACILEQASCQITWHYPLHPSIIHKWQLSCCFNAHHSKHCYYKTNICNDV